MLYLYNALNYYNNIKKNNYVINLLYEKDILI